MMAGSRRRPKPLIFSDMYAYGTHVSRPIIVCGSKFCLQSLWVPVNTNVRCNSGIYKEGPTRSENRGLIWGILVGTCCSCRDSEGQTDARDTVRGVQHLQWKNVGRFFAMCRGTAEFRHARASDERKSSDLCQTSCSPQRAQRSVAPFGKRHTAPRLSHLSFGIFLGPGLVSVRLLLFLILDSHPRFSLSVAKRRRACTCERLPFRCEALQSRTEFQEK